MNAFKIWYSVLWQLCQQEIADEEKWHFNGAEFVPNLHSSSNIWQWRILALNMSFSPLDDEDISVHNRSPSLRGIKKPFNQGCFRCLFAV